MQPFKSLFQNQINTLKTKSKYRIPPKNFSEQEIKLYLSLRECGDTYGSAVDTVMGERLMKRTFPPEHKPLK
jgi:hypothetical protein